MSVKKNLDLIVIDKLKDCIINGEWVPGQQLFIDEIAEKYEISRTPIIQAVKAMSVEGMLTLTNNGKVVVPKFTREQIYDICAVRLLLEKFAIQQICSNESIRITELTQIADRCACTLIEGKIAESRKLDMLFHKQLVKCGGNECLDSVYVKVQGQFEVSSYLIAPHGEDQQSIAVNEHFQLLRTLKVYDYKAAEEVIDFHINTAAEKIVNRLGDRE